MAAELRAAIESHLKKRLNFHLDTLRQMVEINSFTSHAEGVNALGEMTAETFAKLGFEAEFVQSVKGEYGRHLLLHRKGSGPHNIGLVSHLDTVFPAEEERQNDFRWRPDGDKIYGPGTIDIKGGTVMIYMILEAIQEVAPALYDAITWHVLIDASEEDYAEDFGELCVQRLGENCLACLVFECGLVQDDKFLVVVARKGRAILKVEVEGRAAHAGTGHPLGASAILQLADAIKELESYTDYSRDLTLCVGRIAGGTVTNRVPHYAEAELELRAFSREAFQEGIERCLALNDFSTVTSAAGDFDCKVRVELLRQTAPWPREESTERVFALWEKYGAMLGRKAIAQERGGVSDANLICHAVPVLDGLGPSGGNAHCSEQSEDGSKEQEYLYVPSMVPKAVINCLAILELAGGMG